EPDGFRQVGNCSVILSHFQISPASYEVGLRVVRPKPDGDPCVENCIGKGSDFQVAVCQLIVNVAPHGLVFRVSGAKCLEVANGFLKSAKGAVRLTPGEADEQATWVRIETDGRGAVSNGLLVFARLQESHPPPATNTRDETI